MMPHSSIACSVWDQQLSMTRGCDAETQACHVLPKSLQLQRFVAQRKRCMVVRWQGPQACSQKCLYRLHRVTDFEKLVNCHKGENHMHMCIQASYVTARCILSNVR